MYLPIALEDITMHVLTYSSWSGVHTLGRRLIGVPMKLVRIYGLGSIIVLYASQLKPLLYVSTFFPGGVFCKANDLASKHRPL